MDKTAIKNYAIWARNKLIADISYKASLIGITTEGIKNSLLQSIAGTELYDIGTNEPYAITGKEITQRKELSDTINTKAVSSNYQTAYQSVIEEVAYTWFNRLIAIRFMEVNDYLPSHIRVLSSESIEKNEPDIVTDPFDANMTFSEDEKKKISQLKDDNHIDELFKYLFVKQCNELSNSLPMLFEKTDDYSELLLNVPVTDHEGIVYHLIHDIPEENFDVNALDDNGNPIGQVEIIGWMYQYYNEERKNAVINIYKGVVKKEDIPAATQLFTTDWVVKYIVDNSLGRYWIERNPGSKLKNKLTYFVTPKDGSINYIDEKCSPKDIRVFDPCMGSGHFLVYAFEVLMQIYCECGYSERDAAISILENNLYGLDIDYRAFQLSYFALLMKARQYNRLALKTNSKINVYSIQESNGINRDQLKYFGNDLNALERNNAFNQINGLLDTFYDAKEYGSILHVDNYDWSLLQRFIQSISYKGQISFDSIGLEDIQKSLKELIKIGQVMSQKYDVVVTNPPYLNKMDVKLKEYVQSKFKDYSSDLFSVFMYRDFDYCKDNGYTGFMTPFVWMFIKSYERLRNVIISRKSIVTLIQMEYSAFEEATVPICTFVLKNRKSDSPSICFKLSDFKGGMEVQRQRVLEALNNKNCGYFYEAAQGNFSKIPGSPIAYWATFQIMKAFNEIKIEQIADVRQGIIPGNVDEFLRVWFEVSVVKTGFNHKNYQDIVNYGYRWFPYNKGGSYRRWYGNIQHVINMYDNGYDIKYSGKNNNYRLREPELYFKKAITWSKVGSGKFSARYMPEGCLFDIAGCCIFSLNDNLNYLLGMLNSKVAAEILKLISPTINYEVEHIKKIPIKIDTNIFRITDKLVMQNIKLSKEDWDSSETSWDFKYHPLLQETTVNRAYAAWKQICIDRFNTLKSNEEELNRLFIDVYDLQNELSPEEEDKEVSVRKASLGRDIRSLISYAVGCMFGRYSLDAEGLAYAGGDWDSSKYSTFIPDKDNVIPITDEQYLDDDIVGLFIAWLKKVYGEDTHEENLNFIAKALGVKGKTSSDVIRSYFLNDFFKDHCQTYSVTGSGKRPIYWLFDSGKQNGFKALVYMHRYNEDTIGKIRADYLHHIEQIYFGEVTRMQDTIDNSSSAHDVSIAQKRLEKLKKQIKECKEYDEKLGHLALDRTAIDLDDGVKVNYRKVQTGRDGKFYEVLADSKVIMAKDKD